MNDVKVRAEEVKTNLQSINPHLAREAALLAVHNFRLHAGLPLEDHNGPLPSGELIACLMFLVAVGMGKANTKEYVLELIELIPPLN